MSDLLDVDWLCKNQSGVLLLELLQGGAEQHQHRRQLQLQDCLVNFDLCSTTRSCNSRLRGNDIPQRCIRQYQ